MSKRQSNPSPEEIGAVKPPAPSAPPMSVSIQEQAIRFNEAVLDVFYEIGKDAGIINLCEKFKWKLKGWVKIRMQREKT